MQHLLLEDQFDEKDRFQPYYIHLSEAIYGKNFQSPGGEEVLAYAIDTHWPGTVIREALDIGAGCGGNSLFLNRRYNCPVTAIDVTDPFLQIVSERAAEAPSITIYKRSVLDLDEHDRFDLIVCRDVLMYIPDKAKALANIYTAMSAGGKLILIDYCRRESELSIAYSEHIQKGHFSLCTLEQYSRLLAALPFRNVKIDNITGQYISYMACALSNMHHNAGLLDEFMEKDVNYIKKRSADKIAWCMEGSMVWGMITAEK